MAMGFFSPASHSITGRGLAQQAPHEVPLLLFVLMEILVTGSLLRTLPCGLILEATSIINARVRGVLADA